ncbi:transmembrane 4 L6 family member 19 isoform X2 [Larus michahellis]|uniref:transmembrane 4 L6 family member 19 isoform X2 n=1 Tax=Larus michahellis TaxID=119627 RepID=UPI003D9B5D96
MGSGWGRRGAKGSPFLSSSSSPSHAGRPCAWGSAAASWVPACWRWARSLWQPTSSCSSPVGHPSTWRRGTSANTPSSCRVSGEAASLCCWQRPTSRRWGGDALAALTAAPVATTENYVHNRTWSICLEPAGIVAWNAVLFSLLLLISAAEMVLASLQILNGCLGCLCGFCEGK